MKKRKGFYALSYLVVAEMLATFQPMKAQAAEQGNSISILAVASVKASGSVGNVAENTIDGDINTRWASSGDGEWIEFNLGKSKS